MEIRDARSQVAWWWGFVAIACGLSLALHGYALHGGDNDVWLPIVLREMDPRLLPGDALVPGEHARLSVHFDAMALLSRAVGIEWAFFGAYLVVHAALFAAFAALSRELTGDRVAAALAVLLLVLARPLGGTATATVESMLLPRLVAEPFAVLAILAAIRGRAIAAGLSLGAVLLVHPVTALPLFAAVGARALVLRDQWRPAITSVLVGIALGSPIILRHAAARISSNDEILPDQAWWDATRQALAFPFVDLWSSASWLHALALVALLLLGLATSTRRRDVLALLVGPALVAALVIPAAHALQDVGLAVLQPARGLLLVALLAMATSGRTLLDLLAGGTRSALAGGGLLAALLAGWWGLTLALVAVAAVVLARGAIGRPAGGTAAQPVLALLAGALAAVAFVGPWRETALEMIAERPVRAVIVAASAAGLAALSRSIARRRELAPAAGVALVAAMLAWVGPARIEWPWTRPAGALHELGRWAREHAPITTRFIVPPGTRGFRAAARRPVLLESTDAGHALFSREQARLAQEMGARFGAGATLEAMADEVRAGRADALVVPLGAPPVDLPVVHSTSELRVHARDHASFGIAGPP